MLWMGHNLFTHSCADGRLGCFQFLTIKNKAAIYIHVKVFVRTDVSFSRGEMPGRNDHITWQVYV